MVDTLNKTLKLLYIQTFLFTDRDAAITINSVRNRNHATQ